MKTLKVLLAASSFALLLGTVLSANAEPRGSRYLFGARNQTDIATTVVAALAVDATGTRVMDEKKCAKLGDASCASASALLRGILDVDPHAMVGNVPLRTIDQLPAFITQELEARDPPEGIVSMRCMVKSKGLGTSLSNPVAPAGEWVGLPNCVQRPFKKGEKVYVDRRTNVAVLAQFCTNIIEHVIVPTKCALIVYPSDGNDLNVRYEQTGFVDISNDPCTKLLRAGETESDNPFIERCPPEMDNDCSFQAVNAVERRTVQNAGSHWFTPGMNVMSVPMICSEDETKCKIILCKTLYGMTHSLAIGVLPAAYVLKKGQPVAYIYHDANSAHAAFQEGTVPGELYWHFGMY
jgi:hypothetical protein